MWTSDIFFIFQEYGKELEIYICNFSGKQRHVTFFYVMIKILFTNATKCRNLGPVVFRKENRPEHTNKTSI